ncbi:L,D-transpeptidase family protein [Pedobacter sp. ASV28]|uniref:L,D-transpeptidase family protein n=1 Tax=Pedobacter sp. ASV28 TaxID=2795123 RepID=UPI0018ED2BC7|nr:L,D-transpeptidase family protein [Pedobacter sp. ASV28]
MIKTYVYSIFLLCSTGVVKAQDNLVVKEISTLFEENATLTKLNFPNSTQRFYQNTLQQVWTKASDHANKTLEAMSLLSGVCQFGLYQNDYQSDTVFNFKVVVGKPHSQTPTLQSSITYFTTAPDWRVPRSIFEKEFLPKAIKNNNYFNDNHYAVYNLAGQYVETNVANLQEIRKNPAAYYVKQSSGCDNALGVVVFRFANAFDIYLHDTPEQRLFNEDKRALSHGCVRVQHAEQLAGLLLKQDGAKDKNREMTNAISSLQKKDFKLNKPISIKIIYLTCLIKDGLPVNYEDVYQLDQELEKIGFTMLKIKINELTRTV